MATELSRVRHVGCVPVKTRRGVVAALVVCALVAGLSAAPAVAQTQGSGGGGGFPDVAEDAFYAESVGSLAGDGVFSGTECEDGLCPGESIARKTIAVWLVRVLDGSDPDPVADSGFSDIDAAGFHAPFVKRLSELGVTTGCGDGTRFCGDRTVTRAQMAVFLSRAFDLADGPDPGFADVPSDAWYAADVARLAAAGVTGGCGDGTRFCPGDDTTRGQMAVFLARADGRVALPEPPAEPLAPAALVEYEVPADLQGSTQWSVPSPDGSRVLYFRGDSSIGPPGYNFGLGALYVADPDGTGLELISDKALGELYECYDACGSRAYFGWSPDSRHFAYVAYATADWLSDNDDNPFSGQFSVDAALRVAAADGSNTAELAGRLSADQLADIGWSWSPDSGRISYVIEDDERRRRIFVATIDGAGPVQLADDVGYSHRTWSPDSRSITYMIDYLESPDGLGGLLYLHDVLFVATADGSATVQVAPGVRDVDWSPDGRHIAYTTRDRDGNVALFVAAADGADPVQLAEGEQVSHEWSPDGRHIAYTARDGDGNVALFVAAPDGTQTARIAQAGTSISIVRWSPDSRHIAYNRWDESWSNNALFVAAADGANPVKLAEKGYGESAWSPDGLRIAYTTRNTDGNAALFVAAADGGAVVDLASGPDLGLVFRPSASRSRSDVWSPDGRHIAYTTTEDGNRLLFVAAADGSRNVRVADRLYRAGPGGSAAWAPEGGRIAFLEPPAETTDPSYEVSLVAVTIADLDRTVVAAFGVNTCDSHDLLRWTAAGIEVAPVGLCF